MAKNKIVFVCSSCGYESPKWMGKCPACNEWNTFYEEKVVSSTSFNSGKKMPSSSVTSLPLLICHNQKPHSCFLLLKIVPINLVSLSVFFFSPHCFWQMFSEICLLFIHFLKPIFCQ